MTARLRPLGTHLATAVALISLAACLPIPVDYHKKGVRQNVSPDTVDKIQRCVNTKEDILLMLGEPDFASDDGRRIGYRWTKAKLILVSAPLFGGGTETSEFTSTYVLEISFDESNLVTQVSLAKKSSSHTPP